tara:strand:- start:410 stop:1243 length:834 start_codon:yes stop_codon:yes gene_type:complete
MKKIHAVYNSRFSNLDEIKISPLSRAYTFSDSVYEVIPFYNSKIIAFDKHIARLEKSCDALNFLIDINKTTKEISELISMSNLENGYVYYQVSRGVDHIRSHMFDDDISIETFGYAVEHFFESQRLKVMLCEDLRWQRCDIKSTSLLGNVLSMNSAKKKDCDEVIMHKDNILTEGGASNVFFTDDESIFTPSLTTNILPGITRELLINEIKDIGIEVVEDQFTINELKKAKSIWLTSSTKGLAQVVDVVDFEVNIIEDHPLYMQFNKIFKEKFLGGS